MKHRNLIQRIWTVIAVLAIGATFYHYFFGGSDYLLTAIIVFDAVMLLIALPTSAVTFVTAIAAYYVLDMVPLNTDGAYLNTILLVILGTVQWFWLTRFYFPPEQTFQKLDLTA